MFLQSLTFAVRVLRFGFTAMVLQHNLQNIDITLPCANLTA